MRQGLENRAAASTPYALNLRGKVCVVTGAGSGIGAGIARAFAAVGAHVALVVHVASIASLNPQTNSGSYSPSKAGVLLLSRQLAAEWGPRGVRSNRVLPGMIRTALSAKFYEEPGFEARRAAATASRRIGEPEDLAGPALFLASDMAAYVNGAEVLVDGGLGCMLMDMVPRPGFNATAAA
ncbi:SDR family NAD(P)-dependent oxidoreductase [Paraburkholderia sp. BR14374]|uniref:SDR family NAD(P)-dependent oxidoreductase n=1 Tax=Paraburkholderia sp. BR14374 TaxID=3237007 RepID=UPI0034CDEB59